MVKEKVNRGTRRTFRVSITDNDGNLQNPDADTCKVSFHKTGEYFYDSPRGPFECTQISNPGVYGYDWLIPETITLGDWVARFQWKVSDVIDYAEFEFIIEDKRRPWLNKRYARAGSVVVG